MTITTHENKSYPAPHYSLLCINQGDLESYLTQKKIADMLIRNGASPESQDYKGRTYDDACKISFVNYAKGLIKDYIEGGTERLYVKFADFLKYAHEKEEDNLDFLLNISSITDFCTESAEASTVEERSRSHPNNAQKILNLLKATNSKLNDHLDLPPFPEWNDDLDGDMKEDQKVTQPSAGPLQQQGRYRPR